MKIEELEYHDQVSQWKLESVEFSPNLNLLVGLSGAGKTKIIQAIKNLKKIVTGSSLNGIKWQLKFFTKNNLYYEWQGEFELRRQQIIDSLDLDEPEKNLSTTFFVVLNESLTKNKNEVIFTRDLNNIYLYGQETPKVIPFVSAVYLFSEEPEIKPIKENFDKIILNDLPDETITSGSAMADYRVNDNPPKSLIEIKKSQVPIFLKLVWVWKYFPDEFNLIKATFIKIFSILENIRIHSLEKNMFGLRIHDRYRNFLQIEIKEAQVDDWIEQGHISSGMLKTLMYISELYLCPDDSVILIDEFENSLGVNCLDSVTDLILDNPHLQFIITSHHPYIINNISPEYWKIVTRRGSVVTVKTAEDFHISKSRQKAFIDLINVLEEDDDDLEAE